MTKTFSQDLIKEFWGDFVMKKLLEQDAQVLVWSEVGPFTRADLITLHDGFRLVFHPERGRPTHFAVIEPPSRK